MVTFKIGCISLQLVHFCVFNIVYTQNTVTIQIITMCIIKVPSEIQYDKLSADEKYWNSK
eukprot:UN02286